jgi:hypothetical protein
MNQLYQNWQEHFYSRLTAEEIAVRNQEKPEWYRRFLFVFNPFVVLDLTFFTLAVWCIVVWVIIISTEVMEIPTDDHEFFDHFNKLALQHIFYLRLSGLT